MMEVALRGAGVAVGGWCDVVMQCASRAATSSPCCELCGAWRLSQQQPERKPPVLSVAVLLMWLPPAHRREGVG